MPSFLTVVLNDERQFNAPDVRIPMLSLSRVLPQTAPESPYPYREYHSSYDTTEIISNDRLKDSCNLVLKMIDAIENNHIPINKYKGEIFLSRYNLFKDWQTLQEVIFVIDGKHSIAQIAEKCDLSFMTTKKIIDELYVNNLIDFIKN